MAGKFGALKLPSETPAKLFVAHPITGMPLKGLDAEGNEVSSFLECLSLDSRVAKDFDRDVLDRRLTKKARPTGADIDTENLHKAAKLISSTGKWCLIDPESKKVLDVPCNEVNAVELLTECGWLLEQVQEFVRERANFSKG